MYIQDAHLRTYIRTYVCTVQVNYHNNSNGQVLDSYALVAEPKGEATNRDALSFRVCIYVCMYVCISVTVNSGHFDCVTATDARQRE